MTPLMVALGAALGAPARFAVALWLPGRRATFLVNVLGSLLLGLLSHSSAFLGIGFCGAFTTYSAFAVETVESGSWRYVVTTVVACVGAAALGRTLTP